MASEISIHSRLVQNAAHGDGDEDHNDGDDHDDHVNNDDEEDCDDYHQQMSWMMIIML